MYDLFKELIVFNVKYRNCGSAIHVALLVAYKEFDRVNRHKLLTKLEQRQALNYILKLLSSEHFAHLFSPLPVVSLFGVDRHDCIYPGFSVLCELSVELVFYHEKRFWVTYMMIGLTIKSLLNVSFLIPSFRILP